jgi:hypothetical protein
VKQNYGGDLLLESGLTNDITWKVSDNSNLVYNNGTSQLDFTTISNNTSYYNAAALK